MTQATSQPTGTGLRPRLLVVDDDRHFCEMMQVWLERSYDLDFAHDGEEGVRRARQERPDLILLDVMMPKLSGFSLAWVFRHDPFFRGVPVVYCTAHASEFADPDAALGKADACLLKPFSLQQLSSTIERFVRMPPIRCSDFALEVEEQGPRYDADIPCHLQLDAPPPLVGRLIRLALWGALARFPKAGLVEGSLARCSFSDGEASLNVGCRILCCEPDADGCRVGLRFHYQSVTQERAYQKILACVGGSPNATAM